MALRLAAPPSSPRAVTRKAEAALARASLHSVAAMRASEGGAQTTDVCKSTTQSVVQHPEGLVEGVVQGSLDEAASATRVRAWRTAWPRFSNFFASNVLSIDSLAAPPVPSAAPDAFAEAGRVSQQSAGGQLQAEAALVRAAAADVISYSAAISACVKGAQPEQALQLLRTKPQPGGSECVRCFQELA